MIRRYLRPQSKFAACCRLDYEQAVQNGLSVTPVDMLELAKRGIPISSPNSNLLYDEGYKELEFTPTLDHIRGVDIADLWQHKMNMKRNLSELSRKGAFKPDPEPVIAS